MNIQVIWEQGFNLYRFEDGEVRPVDISFASLGEPLSVRFSEPATGESVNLPGAFWSYIALDSRIVMLCRILSMPNRISYLKAIKGNLHDQDKKEIFSSLAFLLLEVSGPH